MGKDMGGVRIRAKCTGEGKGKGKGKGKGNGKGGSKDNGVWEGQVRDSLE